MTEHILYKTIKNILIVLTDFNYVHKKYTRKIFLKYTAICKSVVSTHGLLLELKAPRHMKFEF